MRVLLALVFFCFSVVASVFAEIRTFTGSSEYIMEDNETMSNAQDNAYKEAMREISEQAGVYIESANQTINGRLTHDEIISFTESIIKVREKHFDRDITSNGKIKITAWVTAEIDTEQTEKLLRKRVEAYQKEKEYQKKTQEHTELQAKNKELQSQYIYSSQDYRNLITNGDKLIEQGRFSDAVACYNEAIVIAGEVAEPYSKRGEALRLQDKDEEAMRDFEKALLLNEKDALAHYGCASIYDKRGNREDALKEYRLFIDYADIDTYDNLISIALSRMVVLDKQSL